MAKVGGQSRARRSGLPRNETGLQHSVTPSASKLAQLFEGELLARDQMPSFVSDVILPLPKPPWLRNLM